MSKKLFVQAITKFALGVILVGVLVFVPAGSLLFINGWILMGALFIPMFLAGIVMMIKNPELLKKRLNAKEKQSEQNLVVKLSGLMFVVGFIIAGLSFRLNWYSLPQSISIGATVIFLIYPFIIAKRIKNEEQLLEKELVGYCEYKKKVKYRLIPFIW